MLKPHNLYFVLALVLVAPACGDDDDTSDDTPPGVDAGADAAGPRCIGDWLDPNACTADNSCEPAADVRLNLQVLDQLQLGVDENPEIVRMVPGDANRGVFVSSAARKLTVFTFDETGFEIEGDPINIETPGTTALSSVEVDPTGTYVALTRVDLGEVEGCAKGAVVFVDIDENPGMVLATVPVGYNPDSSAFSKDGKWLVTADEDDREDRPCKPEGRLGGSATIIDLSQGPAAATVAQTIAIDHAADAEPEGVKISPDSDVVLIAIQETNEVGLFRLSDVPNATLTRIPLGADAGPDGMAISPDGSFAVISNEYGDSFSLMELPGGDLISTHAIRGSGEVPDSFPRDDRGSNRVHEPEEIGVATFGGAPFVLVNLQESGALAAYNVADEEDPVLDSIRLTGIAPEFEESGREGSLVGPEGLAIFEPGGILFVANERQGSVAMLKTQFTVPCPE